MRSKQYVKRIYDFKLPENGTFLRHLCSQYGTVKLACNGAKSPTEIPLMCNLSAIAALGISRANASELVIVIAIRSMPLAVSGIIEKQIILYKVIRQNKQSLSCPSNQNPLWRQLMSHG